ncbi:MAG: ATP-binding cassette domain-containing protein, partial [Halothiobacillus sp.]
MLGRNGVGKTTLMRSIMGMVGIKGGAMTFAGQTIPATPPHNAHAPESALYRKAAKYSRCKCATDTA